VSFSAILIASVAVAATADRGLRIPNLARSVLPALSSKAVRPSARALAMIVVASLLS
jgi:hypothetical protein